MSGLRNLFITLLITLFIIFTGGFMFTTSAEASTQSFQWTGKTGYSAQGQFSYDETKALGTISEQGAGKTDTVESLVVTFYDPSGEAMNTYHNVLNGMSGGNYFEFHYDLANQKLLGSIDLGGEFAGEMYLKGTVDGELSLIKVEQPGIDRIIDNNADYRIGDRQK